MGDGIADTGEPVGQPDQKAQGTRTTAPAVPYDRTTRVLLTILIALLVAFCGLMAGWLWRVTRPPRGPAGNSYAAIRQIPESHLYYPGASLLGEIGNDPYRFLGGVASSSAGAYLGVDATQEEVFAFYMAQLAATGWNYTPQRIDIGSTETAGRTWRRGEHEMHVNIVRNSQPDPRLPANITDYRTVYLLRLDYAGLPLPTPVP